MLKLSAAETSPFAGFNESTATVKYVGADSNTYVFNVAYANENGEKFQLRITDEMGNTLFTGTYADKKFEKKI